MLRTSKGQGAGQGSRATAGALQAVAVDGPHFVWPRSERGLDRQARISNDAHGAVSRCPPMCGRAALHGIIAE